MTLTDQSLLRLLQLTDSAFPTGGFAHSFGLETYIAGETVRTVADLEAFITNTLWQGVAPSDGVACVAAYSAGVAYDEVVQALDQRLTAMKIVSEWRAASRALGVRFLRTVTRLYGAPRAAHYLAAIDAKALHGHLSLAYGLAWHDLTLPLQPALTAWLRQHCASLVSVAVRLMPLGQTEGQALLARMGPSILQAVELALAGSLDHMSSFVPGQELAGITHRDRLITRLYLS